VTTEKCYKEQNLISFFHCKQGNQLACYVEMNCFHFVKIDNHSNKSDDTVKRRNLETVANLKELYLHFLLQVFSPTTSLSIVLEI
jgi:hypothetical protein